MRLMQWPEWMDDLWAKSAEKGAGQQPETLAQHTWLVVSRLADFIHLRPDLPQKIGVPRLWHLLYWGAFLHDFGKAASGFQARLHGGDRWPHRHEVFSLLFVDWIAGDMTDDERTWMVAAIVSHHRDASEISVLYPPLFGDDEDEDQIAGRMNEFSATTLNKLWRWLDTCGSAWIEPLKLLEFGVAPEPMLTQKVAVAQARKDGAVRIHHWLDKYSNFVEQINRSTQKPLIVGTLALRGHLINADHSASAHAHAPPRIIFEDSRILASAGLDSSNLFDHQREVATTVGSTMLIAPTGSGKTESALLWATHQAKTTGNLPRLFYTLPYQASMNAMKLRLNDVFGDGNVGLQHGRGLLALYRMLLERENSPNEASRQARWARNLAKLNYPPIRVFSPYQMLKSIYRLKGYEAVLSDYHGAAFVFDEIHAYETKRLAMILKTVEYLAKNFDARFLFMSATFPTLIRDQLTTILGNPTIVHANQALFNQFQRHRLQLLDGELVSEEGIQRVIGDAENGKSVLVVCNIVDRAQEVYGELSRRLAKTGVPVELLHGRFNMRDRSAKEQLIRAATGSRSTVREPIVLVATQAVEVSLDIDLDTIYTEPAPLEALVQRFGRVNRRRKHSGLAPVHVYRLPDDGQKIYEATLVHNTLQVLERENGQPIDESAIGDWLDEIYSGEAAIRWQQEFTKVAREFEAVCLTPLRAFESDPQMEERFDELFDGMQILPMSHYDEYQSLKIEDPILAEELLVSITMRRFHSLANAGQILPKAKGEPFVVKAPYTAEEGLIFERYRADT